MFAVLHEAGRDWQVGALDFDEYMRFHLHRSYRRPFAPKLFAYSIRRADDADAEGTLGLQCSSMPTAMAEPIYTYVRAGIWHGVWSTPC